MGRVVGYVIVLAFVAVVVVVIIFSVRISNGVSRNLGSSGALVRLQVVNGSGISGVGARIASQLSGYVDKDLEIKVIDTSDITTMKVAKSFVISRTGDGSAAQVLATKLGFDASTIVTKALEYDTRLVSATLVVGEDYRVITLKRKTL